MQAADKYRPRGGQTREAARRTPDFLSRVYCVRRRLCYDQQMHNPMFAGLVFDQFERPLAVAFVGGSSFYVLDDDGFRRHIDAEEIDRQVVAVFVEQLRDNQGLAVEQALRMMGQDDLFTKAAVDAELRNVSVDRILGQPLPPQARDMLGMLGFRIVVNHHGEIVRFDQPTGPLSDDDDDGDGDY